MIDSGVNVVNKMYNLRVKIIQAKRELSVSFPAAGLIWNQFKEGKFILTVNITFS